MEKFNLSLIPTDPLSVAPPSTTPHTTPAASSAYTVAATSSAAANHVASLAMGQSAMNGSSQQLFQPTSSECAKRTRAPCDFVATFYVCLDGRRI